MLIAMTQGLYEKGMLMMETKRLTLRHFIKSDSSACFESWGQDKELGKYIITYPMKDVQQIEHFVETLLSNEHAWLIVHKTTNVVIGYVTLDIPYEQLSIGEIGYVIGEKYQKQGYALEALDCILEEYLVNRNLYMIEAKYNETNTASGNLLHKLGFHIDATLRDRRIDLESGKRTNLVICSMTLEEYHKNKTKKP